MHAKDLRSMTTDALKAREGEIRFELNIERRKIASTGVASKKAKTREMRRTIAAILTILKERGVKN